MSINYKNPKTGEKVEISVSMSAPYATLNKAVENMVDVFSTDEQTAKSIISAINAELKHNACMSVAFAENPLLTLVNKPTFGRYKLSNDNDTLILGSENMVMCSDKATPNYIDYKTLKSAVKKYNASAENKYHLSVDFSTADITYFQAVAKFIAKTATDNDYTKCAELGDNFALLADTANKEKSFVPTNENRTAIVQACYDRINNRTKLEVKAVGVVFNNLYKTYAKRDAKTATDTEHGKINNFISLLMIEYINSKELKEDKIKSVFAKKQKAKK